MAQQDRVHKINYLVQGGICTKSSPLREFGTYSSYRLDAEERYLWEKRDRGESEVSVPQEPITKPPNLFRPTQLTQQTTTMYIARQNANALHCAAEN